MSQSTIRAASDTDLYLLCLLKKKSGLIVLVGVFDQSAHLPSLLNLGLVLPFALRFLERPFVVPLVVEDIAIELDSVGRHALQLFPRHVLDLQNLFDRHISYAILYI